MRKLFPTSVKPGGRLTTGWLNNVGAVLNRVERSVPGSSMGGIRTGKFDIDLPPLKTVLQPLEVTRFINDETGEPEAIDFKPEAAVGDFYVKDYRCKLLPFRNASGDAPLYDDGPTYEYEATDANYLVNTYWLGQQFLIPAYMSIYTSGHPSVEVPGDRVFASWDALSGKFVAINPPTTRLARVVDIFLQQGESGTAQVQFAYDQPGTTPLNYSRTGLSVGVTNLMAEEVHADDLVVIEYFQQMRQWFITRFAGSKLATHIEFTLNEPLTASDLSVEAHVDEWYEGTSPGDEDENVTVFNPVAGCTGTSYRFFASAGCRGQAIYSSRAIQYRIWQLDCEAGG